MKLSRSTIAAVVALVLAAAGCSADSSASTDSPDGSAETTTTVMTSDVDQADDVPTDDEAGEGDAPTGDDEVTITLEGDSASSDSSAVEIDGSTVTIQEPGTYRVSGTLDDGQLVVDAEDAGVVWVILDGVDITSSSSAAVAVMDAESAVIELAEGTENHLADGDARATTETETPDAALFSDSDLTITGSGALAIDASYGHGIGSQDALTVEGGTLTVTAPGDGLHGNDLVAVSGDADLTIAAGDDGIHSDSTVTVAGGTIAIEESYEGIEAAVIEMSGGTVDLVASDDGINVAGGADSSGGGPGGGQGGGDQFATGTDQYFLLSGGSLTVDSGGDGLDANGAITITGGSAVVQGPTQDMNGALDVDAAFTIDGGVLVAGGSAGMAESPDAGAQAVIAIRFDGTVSAGSTVEVVAGDGTVIATYTTDKGMAALVVSTPEVASGSTYDVVVDGESLGTVTAG